MDHESVNSTFAQTLSLLSFASHADQHSAASFLQLQNALQQTLGFPDCLLIASNTTSHTIDVRIRAALLLRHHILSTKGATLIQSRQSFMHALIHAISHSDSHPPILRRSFGGALAAIVIISNDVVLLREMNAIMHTLMNLSDSTSVETVLICIQSLLDDASLIQGVDEAHDLYPCLEHLSSFLLHVFANPGHRLWIESAKAMESACAASIIESHEKIDELLQICTHHLYNVAIDQLVIVLRLLCTLHGKVQSLVTDMIVVHKRKILELLTGNHTETQIEVCQLLKIVLQDEDAREQIECIIPEIVLQIPSLLLLSKEAELQIHADYLDSVKMATLAELHPKYFNIESSPPSDGLFGALDDDSYPLESIGGQLSVRSLACEIMSIASKDHSAIVFDAISPFVRDAKSVSMNYTWQQHESFLLFIGLSYEALSKDMSDFGVQMLDYVLQQIHHPHPILQATSLWNISRFSPWMYRENTPCILFEPCLEVLLLKMQSPLFIIQQTSCKCIRSLIISMLPDQIGPYFHTIVKSTVHALENYQITSAIYAYDLAISLFARAKTCTNLTIQLQPLIWRLAQSYEASAIGQQGDFLLAKTLVQIFANSHTTMMEFNDTLFRVCFSKLGQYKGIWNGLASVDTFVSATLELMVSICETRCLSITSLVAMESEIECLSSLLQDESLFNTNSHTQVVNLVGHICNLSQGRLAHSIYPLLASLLTHCTLRHACRFSAYALAALCTAHPPSIEVHLPALFPFTVRMLLELDPLTSPLPTPSNNTPTASDICLLVSRLLCASPQICAPLFMPIAPIYAELAVRVCPLADQQELVHGFLICAAFLGPCASSPHTLRTVNAVREWLRSGVIAQRSPAHHDLASWLSLALQSTHT